MSDKLWQQVLYNTLKSIIFSRHWQSLFAMTQGQLATRSQKKKKKFWPVPALNGCGVNFWLHFLCLIYSMHLNASSMVRLNSTGSVYTMCAFTSMLMHVIWSLRMSAASLQNTHNSLLIMLSLFFCLLLYSIHLSSVFLFTIQITKANLLYS